MPFYGERKRRALRDAAEAEGASFWTETLDDSVRYKLLYATKDAVKDAYDTYELYEGIRSVALKTLGRLNLAGSEHAIDDVHRAIQQAHEDMVLTLIELADIAAGLVDQRRIGNRQETFRQEVRTVLREHRVSFDLVDGAIIPLESTEMHVEVVEPVIRLLHSSPDWVPVEMAYRKALSELHTGTADDAITDAATALQEALDLYGCSGNTVSRKLKSAQTKGILAPHDAKLAAAMRSVGEWVEADRSTLGDAHSSGPVDREDGWLIVHIVGALILRLSKGPRSSEQI